MKKKNNQILYWLTLVWNALALLFVVFMLLGHLFSSESDSLGFKNNFEIVLFALFPVCYAIGLTVALKLRVIGGVISTLALVVLFILRIDILFVPLFAMALLPPAVLCIAEGKING